MYPIRFIDLYCQFCIHYLQWDGWFILLSCTNYLWLPINNSLGTWQPPGFQFIYSRINCVPSFVVPISKFNYKVFPLLSFQMTSSTSHASLSSHGKGISSRRRIAVLLSVLNMLLSVTIAGPVFSKHFQVSHHSKCIVWYGNDSGYR